MTFERISEALQLPSKSSCILVEFSYGLTPTVIRLTDFTSSVVYRGQIYAPVPTMRVDVPKATGGLDEEEFAVTLPLSPFTSAISIGEPFAPITMTVTELFRGAPDSAAHIHFVGDVHQPLHAGHSHDRGGNDVDGLRLLEYTPARERTNLHTVWDDGMVQIRMAREGWTWRDYVDVLDAGISDDMIARWGRGSAYDWIEESRLFAAANGYLHADGKTPIAAKDALGEDWYERNLPVVEQRLQQGGVRLARGLEELF